MIRMQSPKPNRKGVYEIHDISSRKIESYRARGWIPADEKTFNLSEGHWFKVRSAVQEELGLDTAPKSKQEARDFLEQAGYTVYPRAEGE